MRFTAGLDLKSTYNTVPLRLLMEKVTYYLDAKTAAMIAMALQPMTLVTRGDDTERASTCEKGMNQGSSLSPPFFNLYMDSYVNEREDKKNSSQI